LLIHIRAVGGATLIRLRLASAGGPLQARPLLHSPTAQVTKGTISLALDKLEIGNCAGVELRGVQLPLATTWLAEKLGCGTKEKANEFGVQESTRDTKDGGLGARTSPCAFPIPISALRAPSPSSTRWLACTLVARAGGVGEETTRGATRCANVSCTWLLVGIGGAMAWMACLLLRVL